MNAGSTKQEVLDQIAAILKHPGWKVSAGSTEPRIALSEIAENIGVPTLPNESKRMIARSIVESWGLDWYPTYESTGETITRLGLSAVLKAVKLATNQSSSPIPQIVDDGTIETMDDYVIDNEPEFRSIQIGQSYRFPDHANSYPDLEFIDGSKNWFFYTDARIKDLRGLRPQAGIWNPKKIRTATKEERIPFVFCTTYPDRAGTYETPWHDHIDLEEGRVLYFGDNKDPACIEPSLVRGNRVMLENERLQHSSLRSDRELAAPVLLVKAHGDKGLDYGYRTPIGLGVIWKSDWVKHEEPGLTFSNLRFEILLLDLKLDNNSIDMRWVHSRRQSEISSPEANRYAPAAWSTFVEEGLSSLARLQKRDLQPD